MAILSDALLASLRARAEALLAHTCTISRPGTPTLDANGGETSTYTAVASGVACMLRPLGQGDERYVAAGVVAQASWVVRLPAGTDVRALDRLVTSVDGESKTLEVLPPTGSSSYELVRTVACTEIT